MVKWEYMTVDLKTESLATIDEFLDERGDDGWELVGFSPDPASTRLIFILKRRRDN